MRPLLWKEIHDLRAWLLAGLALVGSLQLLLLTQVFLGAFVGTWMEALLPLAAGGAAIGMGVAQVARERHARTLDFLLARPVPAGVIVWSKFLAGSIVLMILIAAAVALGYADPAFTEDSGLTVIRDQVSLGQLLVTLLPRFWFLYALALFFSVLVDRPVKAAILCGVVAITCVSLAEEFADLAPFSGFGYWLPFFDSTGGLIQAAKNTWLSGMTGLIYSGGVLLVTGVSAMLIKRSPERYLGNRGIAAAAMLAICGAIGSAAIAANRLQVVGPTGSFALKGAGNWDSAGILASGTQVAVTSDRAVRFLDFSDPSRPRQIADVEIPIWKTSVEWIPQAAMQDGAVYLSGEKKQVPVDDVEIAIVRPAGPIEAISVGPVRPGSYVSTPMPVGRFLLVGVTRDRVSSLITYDLATKRQVASLPIDQIRPPEPGKDERGAPLRLLHRGDYLYFASASFLSTIDIADPLHPTITSQLAVHPKARFLYGFPRPLAWQDDRLFEIRIFPETLSSYQLRDPARPAAEGELIYRGGMTIENTGRMMYSPWRRGVLAFRARGGDVTAERYLRAHDNAIAALASSGDYVYSLSAPDKQQGRSVHAFLNPREGR